ncbi:calpain-B-like isoform X2 [Pollicipes pollicipes]|uniref:calpain-B-like isoform X2 n=1 Tax=Pollicipes pollicipes TaxID=41117 RepID=UPI001884C1D8|nr:calpain-B-like isoform X2 [Pollicipes pollicipes]
MSFLFGGGDDRRGGGGGGFFGDLVGAVANEVIDNIQDDGQDGRERRTRSNQVEAGGTLDLGDIIGAGVKHFGGGGGGGGSSGGGGGGMDDIIGAMSNKTRDDRTDEERNSGGGGGGGGGYGGQGGGGGASDILGGIMGMIGGGGGGGGGGAAPAHPSMKHGGKGVGGVNMGSLIQSAFGNALGGGGGGGGGGGAAGLLQGLISGAVSGAGGGHGQGGGNAASGNLLGTIIGALSGGKNMGNQSDVTKGGNAMGDMFKTAVGHTLNSNPGSGGIGIIGDLVKKAIGWIVEKFFNLKGKYALKSRRGDAFNPAATVFNMNERGSGLRPRGTVQDFDKLRSEALRSGQMFEDPEFTAEDCSIFFSRSPPRPFDWLRPSEIVRSPQFISKDASRFDVQQGELGDCWLLAAVANLTLNGDLFAQIVPDNQSFDDQYAGIFHFRFWQYGRWVDVVVDDRLPTYNGQLVFMHSEDNNEFWSALLEKAYAKLHGSYEALKGGTTCEAMEDFSGGVTEMYDIDKAPDNLFQILQKADERKSLMGCSIEPDPNVLEAELPNGLIRGHAYSITKVCLADIETPRVSGQIPMIRIRNPWGNEAEWKGAFSDSSPEWQYIPEESRQQIGLTFDADGEFWMTFKDFLGNFQRLEVCNLSPDSLEDDDEEIKTKRWEMSVFEGAWVRGATAGGCRNYISTFAYNPQYMVNLTDPDEDDDEDKCTVIVALMQKNRRAQRKLGLDCLTVGFAIYHVSDPSGAPTPLDTSYFRYNSSVARAPSFINLREVSCRFKLPPGTYCIVPSTFEPNEEGEFLIRVFSEKKNNMEENDQEVGPGKVDDSVKPELEEESEYDQMVREFFNKIAGDDLEIDWQELKQVLDYALKKEFEFEGFSKDTARSMIALMDVDNSGKLGLEEFKTLWNCIRVWKTVFKQHDADGTGFLSAFELRSALNEAGYRVNNNLLGSLMHRYGDKEGRVAFDDFMACAVKMKTCIEIFRDRDPEKTNQAIFSLEDWMEYNMYS